MYCITRLRRNSFALFVLAGVLSIAAACKDDSPKSEKTEGGESGLESAERDLNRAHQNFKQEVKPEAEWVDEKTKKTVDEGKKAAHKTGEAIDESVDGDDDDDESDED